jgi:hypothetical protein
MGHGVAPSVAGLRGRHEDHLLFDQSLPHGFADRPPIDIPLASPSPSRDAPPYLAFHALETVRRPLRRMAWA